MMLEAVGELEKLAVRDGDVGVVGGWRGGDVGGSGADRDTTHDNCSKAAVMCSNDEEDSFTIYAKSRRELTKRKATIRKRNDEEKDDDGSEAEEVGEDAAEAEEEDDDNDKNNKEEQEGMKQP